MWKCYPYPNHTHSSREEQQKRSITIRAPELVLVNVGDNFLQPLQLPSRRRDYHLLEPSLVAEYVERVLGPTQSDVQPVGFRHETRTISNRHTVSNIISDCHIKYDYFPLAALGGSNLADGDFLQDPDPVPRRRRCSVQKDDDETECHMVSKSRCDLS